MGRIIEFPHLDNEPLPRISIGIRYENVFLTAEALLDTGSTVNVLPYDLGIRLGAVW